MDIQKEREEFEAEFLKQHNGLSFWLNTWCLSANSYSHPTAEWAWVMWKAAKAQAIPDGFVLVPKEPSSKLVNHGHQVFSGHFNGGGQTGGRSLYFAYKAMVDAGHENK